MVTAKDKDSNDCGVANSKRLRLLQDTGVVTVRVGQGKDAESWTIHRGLLIYHSPFFAAALNGSFMESKTNTVELIEDDPGAFTHFVLWLYTGKFETELDGLFGNTCLAWALGDKLQCPTCQDRAMCHLLVQYKKGYFDEDTMRLIYNVSPPGSKLRSFAVDQVCWDRSIDEQTIGAAAVVSVEDFDKDLLERLLPYDNEAEDPHLQGSRYMKVLDYETCKLPWT
ncbi:MAG: hypothetical protein L6R42_007013 [Xanthoria sp. 1 TBL-2021]|nr:MAG: hypothetical protein L6R42_007013 [Xanthoria sp. 1 TBL-2021]